MGDGHVLLATAGALEKVPHPRDDSAGEAGDLLRYRLGVVHDLDRGCTSSKHALSQERIGTDLHDADNISWQGVRRAS